MSIPTKFCGKYLREPAHIEKPSVKNIFMWFDDKSTFLYIKRDGFMRCEMNGTIKMEDQIDNRIDNRIFSCHKIIKEEIESVDQYFDSIECGAKLQIIKLKLNNGKLVKFYEIRDFCIISMIGALVDNIKTKDSNISDLKKELSKVEDRAYDAETKLEHAIAYHEIINTP